MQVDSKSYLFIGGPLHLQRKLVPEEKNSYECQVFEEETSCLNSYSNKQPRRTFYRKVEIENATHVFKVFTCLNGYSTMQHIRTRFQ